MAQHHGKPDAALNSVELDLIKAVCAEDQDGKGRAGSEGKTQTQKKTVDPCFSHEDSSIMNKQFQTFGGQGPSVADF